jgi:hypothetical protein
MLTRGCHQLALAREAIVTPRETVTKWQSRARARPVRHSKKGESNCSFVFPRPRTPRACARECHLVTARGTDRIQPSDVETAGKRVMTHLSLRAIDPDAPSALTNGRRTTRARPLERVAELTLDPITHTTGPVTVGNGSEMARWRSAPRPCVPPPRYRQSARGARAAISMLRPYWRRVRDSTG